MPDDELRALVGCTKQEFSALTPWKQRQLWRPHSEAPLDAQRQAELVMKHKEAAKEAILAGQRQVMQAYQKGHLEQREAILKLKAMPQPEKEKQLAAVDATFAAQVKQAQGAFAQSLAAIGMQSDDEHNPWFKHGGAALEPCVSKSLEPLRGSLVRPLTC